MTEVLYEYDYDDMLQIDLDNFYQFEHLFNDTEGINVSRITNQGVKNLSLIQKVFNKSFFSDFIPESPKMNTL